MYQRTHKVGRIGIANHGRLLVMIAEGKTAIEMGEILNVDAETVRKFARKRGLTIRPQPMAMENHPCWQGGTLLDKHGYRMRRVDRNGPYGYLIRAGRKDDARGYALEHRIVMHDKIGRRLTKKEVVHHMDGDKTNNDPENLFLFDGNADHLRHELTGRIPNWTEDGKRRILEGVRKSARTYKSRRLAKLGHPKTDDPQSP